MNLLGPGFRRNDGLRLFLASYETITDRNSRAKRYLKSPIDNQQSTIPVRPRRTGLAAMIVYHGTTERRARQISKLGFYPMKPSRRVWFAESRRYALGRARTQARRSHDRPVVLTCELDVQQARHRYGKSKVFQNRRVIAIKAKVPVSVLRTFPGAADTPVSPMELANWVNRLLGLRRHKGVGPRHPGIQRLSEWVIKRLATGARNSVNRTELVDMARRWVPELFEGYVVDAERFKAYRPVKTIEVETVVDDTVSIRETEALECLESPRVKRRVCGLRILAELEDPDLYEWCSMHLEDESEEMQIAALHTMLSCASIEPEAVLPLAESESKRLRAAAIATLAKHADQDKTDWLRLGLTDPETCVRVETARVLPDLDPVQYKSVFSIALHDPNPEVASRAEKLTRGKAFTTWR